MEVLGAGISLDDRAVEKDGSPALEGSAANADQERDTAYLHGQGKSKEVASLLVPRIPRQRVESTWMELGW